MRVSFPMVYFAVLKLPTRMANSIHVMKMCQGLKRTGVDVTLIANIDGPAERYYEDYDIRDRFNIRHTWMPPIPVLASVGFILAALVYLWRHRPDCIYTRDFWSSWFFNLLGVPIVYECHEDPLDGLRRFFLRRTLKAKNVQVVVTISEQLKKILKSKYEWCLRGKSLLVLPDGVDVGAYTGPGKKRAIRTDRQLPLDIPLIGYTGSLFEGRGIEVIIEAASRRPQYRFLVVGGYEAEVDALMGTLADRQIDNVICPGYVPHRLIPDYLAACDVLVMPYQRKVTLEKNKRDTAAYMSPLKMFEYLASGVPVVSSDLPVLREILTHGETAWLVAADEAAAWCEAADLLINDGTLAEHIGDNARRHVLRFSWDRRAERVLEALGVPAGGEASDENG